MHSVFFAYALSSCLLRGWSGVAKVSYLLRHWGIQLILAYSWARPAILVAGKGRRECFYFFCFFPFIPFLLSSLSLSFISSAICSIFFLPFSGRWHKMTHMSWCKPQHNQSKSSCLSRFTSFHSYVYSFFINFHKNAALWISYIKEIILFLA